MKSTYWANKVLDVTTGKIAAYQHPTPGVVYIALFQNTTTLNPDITLTEPTGVGGYVRKATAAANWDAAADRETQTAALIALFVSTGAIAGALTGWALFDALAGGNLLDFDNFEGGATYTVAGAGTTVRFNAGALSLTEA